MARLTKQEAAARATEAATDAIVALRAGNYEEAREFLADGLGRTSAILAMPERARRVPEPDDDPRYSSSLLTGLRILGLFVDESVTLGVAEIADSLQAPRSTVHRYLITLVLAGQLEQPIGASRKYRRPQISDVPVAA